MLVSEGAGTAKIREMGSEVFVEGGVRRLINTVKGKAGATPWFAKPHSILLQLGWIAPGGSFAEIFRLRSDSGYHCDASEEISGEMVSINF